MSLTLWALPGFTQGVVPGEVYDVGDKSISGLADGRTYNLPPGCEMRVLPADGKTPSWAVRVQTPSEAVFYVGKDMILKYSKLRAGPSTAPGVESQAATRQAENTAAQAIAAVQGLNEQPAPCPPTRRGVPELNAAWTYAAAKDYIKNTNFRGALVIEPRASWGASPPKLSDMKRQEAPNKLVIHHTGGGSTDPRSIQRHHVETNGWADIGYHYIVTPDGRVLEARNPQYQGAHAGKDRNPKTLGILIMGNFEPATASNLSGFSPGSAEHERQPNPAQIDALGRLVQSLMDSQPSLTQVMAHGAGPLAINPRHSQCPGEGCLHVVAALAERFNRRDPT